MKRSINLLFVLNGLLLLLLLTVSVNRDLHLEKQYQIDLRNRVVGARLQEDKKLPYSYNWTPADGTRYYDVGNFHHGRNGISNITATPVFHYLLLPLCDLPEQNIARLWLWLQYFFLLSMIFFFCNMTGTLWKRWLIVNVGVLFTATAAWVVLMHNGQIYLSLAFLVSAAIWLLSFNKKITLAIAGLLFALFFLTRPTAIVMLIPLIFNFRKYRMVLATILVSLGLYAFFVWTNPYQKILYRDYAKGMKMNTAIHQGSFPASYFDTMTVPPLVNIEGYNENTIRQDALEHPIPFASENGNFFVIYHKISGGKLSLGALTATMIIGVIALTVWFQRQTVHFAPEPAQIILFSGLLYLIVEFFSPIYRHQYNTVVWFPFVLMAFLPLRNTRDPVFLLLIFGLILNISQAPWLPMRHTLGECCWMLALMLLVFSPAYKTAT